MAFTARTRHDNNDELRYARRIAAHLGVQHRIIEITSDLMSGVDEIVASHGEAFCDSSALPSFAICREVGRSFRVVLTGDGGDEVQGGYSTAALASLRALIWSGDVPGTEGTRWREALAGRLDDRERRLLGGLPAWRFRLLRLTAPPLTALTLRHDGLDGVAALFSSESRAALGEDEWQPWLRHRLRRLGAPSGLDAQLGFDFSSYLADDLNVKVDVAGMASSLEARCPLLDLDFVNACWKVRTLDRVRPWDRKRVIKRLARRYLPKDMLIPRKHGFSVPVYGWLKSSGASDDLCADLRAQRTGLESVLDATSVLRVIEAQRSPGELAWRLFTLTRWTRWIDRVATGASRH